MRNGLSKFKEEFPSDNVQISLALGKAILTDNQNALNQLIAAHFSSPETSGLLDGAIAVYVDDDEEVHIYPPAILAVMSGSKKVLRTILSHTRNPNVRENPDDPEHSSTLLIKAVHRSDIEMVKLILEEGADVNETWVYINEDGEKIGPLSAFSAAVVNGLTKTSNLLLDNGAIPTADEASRIIMASDELDPLLVRVIDQHPELLHREQESGGLLHKAATSNNVTSIKWLVDQGANVNAVANDGTTPLDWAAHSEEKEIAAFLQSVGGISGMRDAATVLQDTSATKQEITENIERLELLEEKFGIAISGLYASYNYDAEYVCAHRVRINFDLTSLNGGQLERNFKLIASAYNSAGQLLGTDTTYINADDFMGFSPTSITLALDQMPEKIRLFPANP